MKNFEFEKHQQDYCYTLHTNFEITEREETLLKLTNGVDDAWIAHGTRYSARFKIGSLFEAEEVFANIKKILD